MIDESCLTSTDDRDKTLIQVGFQIFQFCNFVHKILSIWFWSHPVKEDELMANVL